MAAYSNDGPDPSELTKEQQIQNDISEITKKIRTAKSLSDIDTIILQIDSVREAIINFNGPKNDYIIRINTVIHKLLKYKMKLLKIIKNYKFPTTKPQYYVPNPNANNGYGSNIDHLPELPNNGYGSNIDHLPELPSGGRRKRTRKHKNRRRRTHRK